MSTVKDLKDYKKELYASQTRELESFEKNFILIASSILAFSVTFIKEIVRPDEVTLLFFLFAGWGLIICAVGLMMWAFLKSANSSTELSKHVDDFLTALNKFDPADPLTPADIQLYKQESGRIFYACKNQLKNIRYGAVLTFVIGFASFSFFVGYNILQEKKSKESSETSNSAQYPRCVVSSDVISVIGKSKDTLVTVNYNSKQIKDSTHPQTPHTAVYSELKIKSK